MPLDTLDEPTLRRLYLEDGRTETEIAHLYQTTQVQVGRLRKKWGITTLLKSDRLALPSELSARLRSVFVGSMLGDGHLSGVGAHTARYSEHHSAKQRPYLDWKASEWGDFVLSVIPTDKGFRFTTHACRVLHPYWQMFYPAGVGAKTFAHLPLEWVDELALAVWFMDDGSRTESYARFSVSGHGSDTQVLLAVLRRLGLEGHLYGKGGEQSLHVQGRTNYSRFLELVTPHVHPSMGYKLEPLVVRKLGPAPRDVLTPERLLPLVERGFAAQSIAGILGPSRQSVRRALERMGVESKVGRPRKVEGRLLPVDVAETVVHNLDPKAVGYEDAVLNTLLKTDIPIPCLSEAGLRNDLALLLRANPRVDGDTIVGLSKGGGALCNQLFPHRWEARYRDQPSVREAWYDAKQLRRAIRFQFAVGDPVTPVRVFRALQAVVRGPTNFRPCFAKALVEAYCPEGGVVLDPCAGYGGRALGTLAASRVYVGVDPHPQAKASYDRLRDFLPGSLTFYNEPFETVDLGDLRADLVLTSPPYFSVERYSTDSSQSWVRYKTWAAWRDGFLRAFVQKAWDHLRVGGVFCVNTKNLRVGRQTVPLADDFLALALACGFQHETTLALPMGRLGKVAQTEPVFTLRR